ncbi:hypothetical protein PQR62_17190 [Herbaspirillum lusitanum]|uniref:Uncharacterized protein n=1 Tax=Herbaspirillum lusitanum TaxID=213312 RepID=A0ABW9ADP6_9BURK
MDSIKEVMSSVVDWFKNRAINPFFAAFIFSWVTVNWRLILALVSDESYRKKIEWIDTRLYPDLWNSVLFCLIEPMVLAALYVLCGPPIFRRVLTYYRRQQHLTRHQLMLADKITPIDQARAERLVAERVSLLTRIAELKTTATEREQEYVDLLESERAKYSELQTQYLALEAGKRELVKIPEQRERLKNWIDLSEVEILGAIDSFSLETIRKRGIYHVELRVLEIIAKNLRLGNGALMSSLPEDELQIKTAIAKLVNLKLLRDNDGDYVLSGAGEQVLAWIHQTYAP